MFHVCHVTCTCHVTCHITYYVWTWHKPVKENGRKGFLLLINWTGIKDDRWDMSHDRHDMSHDTWWHDITSEMTCDRYAEEFNCCFIYIVRIAIKLCEI